LLRYFVLLSLHYFDHADIIAARRQPLTMPPPMLPLRRQSTLGAAAA